MAQAARSDPQPAEISEAVLDASRDLSRSASGVLRCEPEPDYADPSECCASCGDPSDDLDEDGWGSCCAAHGWR